MKKKSTSELWTDRIGVPGPAIGGGLPSERRPLSAPADMVRRPRWAVSTPMVVCVSFGSDGVTRGDR